MEPAANRATRIVAALGVVVMAVSLAEIATPGEATVSEASKTWNWGKAVKACGASTD
jgi:hypothetical protein